MALRHFLHLKDFSPAELHELLALAKTLKKLLKSGQDHSLLKGKCLAMLFEKPSNRTRMSFEVGMFQLGGTAINVNRDEIRMIERESIPDTAHTLSRYVDAVMIRAFYHWTIAEFAENSSVPVINGLSDHHHPCQALADVLTIQEKFGTLQDVRLCYVGDGNNVCNSLIEVCTHLGMEIVVCAPPGYQPLLKQESPLVKVISDPREAVRGVDVVYTDVWVSMGQEKTTSRRIEDFKNYTVSAELMKLADPKAIFMHCLPAKRGYEVDAEVIDGKQSVVFDQAENRLHAQKAVLAVLVAPERARELHV